MWKVVINNILLYFLIGTVIGYILVARIGLNNVAEYIMSCICFYVLLCTAYTLWIALVPHWVAWLSAFSLCMPILYISYKFAYIAGWTLWPLEYWQGWNPFCRNNLSAQFGYIILICVELTIKTLIYKYVYDYERCAKCGYSLRELNSNYCPECGNYISKDRAPYKAIIYRWDDMEFGGHHEES